MKNRRLLAMLLVFCLVFANLAPAASAVEAPADSVVNAQKTDESITTDKITESSQNNSLIVSSDVEEKNVPTLKNNEVVKSEIVKPALGENKSWEFTPAKAPDTSLLNAKAPECLAELKKAAELYEVDEIVHAFVVMEEAALAESHTSPSLVSASVEKQMIEKQNAVISAIEKTVLMGNKLTVRYQFTYLTNAFSVETEFANLEKIAKLNGVKSVYIMPVYDAIPTNEATAEPNTAAAGKMTGVAQVWEEFGYTGKGMKIGIIDTGLDLDHPSFAASPASPAMDVDDVAAALPDLNAYARKSSLTADQLYRSEKVPYAFNYCDNNLTADHSSDNMGDHGSHVAGIAAANKLEGTEVVGMAPDAQVLVMKVFGANGGAYTDDIVAALEDAMTLGCDVVNLSLGSSGGFSSENEEIDQIYERLDKQDIIATISAGNEDVSSDENMWGTDLNRTANPDNATVGSPGTYANATTIASADNASFPAYYFHIADGTKVYYNDPGTYHAGILLNLVLADDSYEYVIIDGLGYGENFYDAEGNSLVEGKIAVVKRGELAFGEKVANAENAGAIGCLIWNNASGDVFNFSMDLTFNDDYPYIPVGLISLEDGDRMAAAATKTLTVAENSEAYPNATAGQMSSFSSWGASPNLSLEPDLTGIGGSVLSCYDGGNYGLMSGTSMSAPQIAGVTALVMQRLKVLYPDADVGIVRDLAQAMMMSTADPIVDSESQVEASPRQQGAGLVDAYEAVTADAYLTVGGEAPKAELGDGTTGTYTFSFEVHNISNVDKTYSFKSSLLTEAALSDLGEYWMGGFDKALSGSVTFGQESVTVPAGGTAEVSVTVQLSEEDKAYFAEYWKNGGYVEGFVYLTSIDAEGLMEELNLPFMGFYGDWTKAPVFDTAFWYSNSMWDAGDGSVDGDEYWHIFWTDLAGTQWVLGFNPYSGALVDNNGNVIYDETNNVVSPNGDGVLDGIDDIYLSLLRNAKSLTFTYSVDGKPVHRETTLNNTKTMFLSSYGRIVPWIYSWYGAGLYDFAGLESGTKVDLTIDAKVDYGTGGSHTLNLPIYVDTAAPELLGVYEMEQDGRYYLAVEASDDVSLASVVLMNPSGSRIYGQWYDDYGIEKTERGTDITLFDVTELGTEFMVALCDYGCNESFFNVTYTSAGSNVPQMPTDQLYAYRVFDSMIYSDHMYGWVSLALNEAETGNSANISVWTDDYLEYAALNAAEYVGGKIFAVDAVYNLVVMDPGLFDRHPICNLGVNVMDMSFDDSTDTMYVLTKDDSYVALNTMDLLTGELTQIKDFGYYYYAPMAIADDDNGTLYAIKYSGTNLYALTEQNDYAMTAVVDAEGNTFVVTDSEGKNTAPQYAQGLIYQDGTLYWAYYKSSWSGDTSEIIAVDMETLETAYYTYAAMAYDTENNLVEYYPDTELVGLLSLEETEYQIPEATALSGLVLSTDSLLMKVGETAEVSASPLPWNYDVQSMTWTSSDEDVVTVSDGKIVAVGEGSATVTVNADGFEATVEVKTVLVQGHFNAYNYFSYDGYYGRMIDVDMETMDYYLNSAAPVDFISGEYNGHDGFFYGYTENGQMYRWDMEQNDISAVGLICDTFPVDMAYDYSTGMMYGMFTDMNTYESELRVINMKTGATETVLDITDDYGMYAVMTLACDSKGTLYMLDFSGMLYEVSTEDYSMGYGVFEESLGSANYIQSMCWDYANDVLIWANCDGVSVNWIDVEEGYMLQLGDPTDSGLFEFVALYTVPETIPELPEIAVSNVEANDMLLLVGGEKAVDITVYPFNATNQDMVLSSSDESVVTVADGLAVGVGAGEAEISYKLIDGENTFEGSIQVTVLQGADNVYGHILADLTYGNLQAWAQIFPEDTLNPEYLYSTDYVLFAEEYVDGTVYAYGYDPNDWTANWQYFVLDAATYEIKSMTDMGESFPYVYDMTFDYATGAMYAVAGASEDEQNLYVMDMNTGAATLLLQTEQNFMSIAAARDGKLYAIENSAQEIIGYDDWGWEIYGYTNAKLYSIDAKTLEVTLVGDTGMQCDMIASMAYDFDTDVLYWTPLSQYGNGISGLAIVDTETGAATNLGTIGATGSQVSGLYIVADEYPEVNTSELYNVILNPSKISLNVGETASVSLNTIPVNLSGAAVNWSSSDEKVATVDANGTVTALAQGKTTVTVSVTHNGKTLSADCAVAVLEADASFLSWNRTDMGWSAISRADYTQVTNLTEGEAVGVQSFTSIGSDVYGYDSNNMLFKLNSDDYSRTAIGESDAAYAINAYITEQELGDSMTEDDFGFEVRDMAYDEANDRMLVLGAVMMYYSDMDMYEEVNFGNAIYAVDLTTGKLTKLYNFDDAYYVYGLACDTEGTVYYYTTYDDGIYKLNLQDKAVTKLVSLQTQSLYGEYGGDIRQAMHYDTLTDMLFMTFTSNGNYYRMVTIDAATGALSAYNADGDQMYIGEIAEIDWAYIGDMFNGLTFAGSLCKHTWIDATCETPKTCSICGETEGEALGHIWNDATCTSPKTCTVCGETEDAALDHTWTDATCTAPKTCSVCGETEGEALGHTWTDATCTTPKTCSVCGETEGKKLGHSYGDWVANGNKEIRTCSVCGETEERDVQKRENPFVDVVESDYFYDAVLWAADEGITAGYGANDIFAPNVTCTRGQVVTFLWRTAGEPEPATSENPFKDVAASEYYYKAVLWAVEEGITEGYGTNDIFNPNGNCTRGQVATFLWRYFGKPAAANSNNPFADVANGAFYYDAVLWAVEQGITNGYGNDFTFAPDVECTRAQIVTFLYRAMN